MCQEPEYEPDYPEIGHFYGDQEKAIAIGLLKPIVVRQSIAGLVIMRVVILRHTHRSMLNWFNMSTYGKGKDVFYSLRIH